MKRKDHLRTELENSLYEFLQLRLRAERNSYLLPEVFWVRLHDLEQQLELIGKQFGDERVTHTSMRLS